MRAGHSGCGAPDPHTYMQANRNSHTTSTKCQYHAANSKPRCCVGVNWTATARDRQTGRKIGPMMTWAPWKPVAMKNAAPYMLPAKWNAAWAYSQACTQVKVRPSAMVSTRPQIKPLRLFSNSARVGRGPVGARGRGRGAPVQ